MIPFFPHWLFYPTFKSYARWRTYCSNFNSLYCSKEKKRLIMNDINLKAKKDQSKFKPWSFLMNIMCSWDLIEIKSSLVDIFKNKLIIKIELDFFQISFSNPTTWNLCPISIKFRYSDASTIINAAVLIVIVSLSVLS